MPGRLDALDADDLPPDAAGQQDRLADRVAQVAHRRQRDRADAHPAPRELRELDDPGPDGETAARLGGEEARGDQALHVPVGGRARDAELPCDVGGRDRRPRVVEEREHPQRAVGGPVARSVGHAPGDGQAPPRGPADHAREGRSARRRRPRLEQAAVEAPVGVQGWYCANIHTPAPGPSARAWRSSASRMALRLRGAQILGRVQRRHLAQPRAALRDEHRRAGRRRRGPSSVPRAALRRCWVFVASTRALDVGVVVVRPGLGWARRTAPVAASSSSSATVSSS